MTILLIGEVCCCFDAGVGVDVCVRVGAGVDSFGVSCRC